MVFVRTFLIITALVLVWMAIRTETLAQAATPDTPPAAASTLQPTSSQGSP